MTTVEDPPRPEAEAPPREEPSASRRFAKIFGAVAAGVGFVSSVAGLVFLFVPWLQPDDDPPPPPPAAQFGRLSGVVLDGDATRRQYLERSDQPKLGFTDAQLARPGALVQFKVELVGYLGKPIPLQRELVDARTGDELPGSQLRAVTITPPSNHVSAPWYDWVELRPGTGRYVVVIKLLDETRTRALDCVQSPPFGGLGGLEPGDEIALCATE